MNATAERTLPPLAARTKYHKLDLAYQIAEGIRTLHFGPNRFTSTFCTHFVTLVQLQKFLARDELQQYANNGYMNVPWNAKTLHQLALEVDEMQSKLLTSMKAEMAGDVSPELIADYMAGRMDFDENAIIEGESHG